MMKIMQSNFSLILLLLLPIAIDGFSPAVAVPVLSGAPPSATALSMTKKFPAGRPNTDQVDEDMAMWFEDTKTGKRKQALKKPVGGRPVTLYTKDQVEAIEKKGVNPVAELKIFMEWLVNRPRRGY